MGSWMGVEGSWMGGKREMKWRRAEGEGREGEGTVGGEMNGRLVGELNAGQQI